jgi:ribosome assembly protein SQT1
VVDVKFNVAGTLLASAGMDGLVKVWTVADGAEAKTLDGPTEDITWVQWHPKGDIVLAGSSDMSVWMWNAGTGDSMMVFSGHTDSVTCGSFSEDGRLVMTGSADGSARVWNPKDGNCVVTMQDARGNSKGAFHEQAVQCLHTVGNLLLTGSEDATAILTQITTDEYGGFAGKVIARFRHHTHSVEAVAIHPVSHYCATGSLDGKVMVYESHADAPRFVCAHDAGVTRVQWMRARDVLLSAGMDRTVRAWDGRGGAPLAVWTGHRDVVFDVAASADGAHVVSGADDNDALCWQFPSV